MPANRNAILRYKTIDRMLQRGRQATLEELVYACNDALQETLGYGKVSLRSVQHDIREMRYSEILGYYAPIIVVDKKYYTYEDKHYSIADTPLTDYDMERLSEAVDLLKQLSSSKGFRGVEDVVNRLEDHVASMRFKANPVILLESNDRLRGLQYMSELHDAIVERLCLTVTYKPFIWPEAQTFFFSPYILKEFRNRWFAFGKRHDDTEHQVVILALDRIEGADTAPKGTAYVYNSGFDPQTFFRDIVGVTRYDAPVEHVVFKVTKNQAPYVRTKPLHHSQKELGTTLDGDVLFSIDVILNHELERDLLGYGEYLTVIAPGNLVEKLRRRLSQSLEKYISTE